MSFNQFIKRRFRLILALFVLILIAIQFIIPEKNISSIPAGKAFVEHFKTDVKIYGLLSTSCFDCHSNNTNYPWYSNIQPIGWIMADHINKGKGKLNFDSLTTYGNRKLTSKFNEIVSEIKKGNMPLDSYLYIHQDANLNEFDKQLLIDFFNSQLTN